MLRKRIYSLSHAFEAAGSMDVNGVPKNSTPANFVGNLRHFCDLIHPHKTCLLRLIVLILAIHAATSFEAAADGSHSSSDNQNSNSNSKLIEPGELILPNSAAFKAALAEYNETGMLIEFFLPWCGHSRRLRPELAQVGWNGYIFRGLISMLVLITYLISLIPRCAAAAAVIASTGS